MKHDSYVRFLKSDQYKSCIMAAMEGKQLPYPGNLVDGSTVPDKVDNTKVHSLLFYGRWRTDCCCFVFLGYVKVGRQWSNFLVFCGCLSLPVYSHQRMKHISCIVKINYFDK